MDNLYNQKVIQANNLFDDPFLNNRMLYLYYFNRVPNIHYIGQIDGEKTFAAIREKFAGSIQNIHQYTWYKKAKKRFEFDTTILVLDKDCMIEFNNSYCEILHDGQQPDMVETISALAIGFKVRRRREPLEINIVVQTRYRLELKAMEIKRTKLDLDLFYEDDFKQTDAQIRKRLNKEEDKGIVLLHGLPGTGKTTYLRYLISKIKKKVLFLSPAVAGNLLNPDFIELLINNPDSVVIIEDAENIIMDRRFGPGSAVSNLLNISDGLLTDSLNVQLICTFNNSLTIVDSALLRKGRLIARYEFGKLGITRAQRLSEHFGFDMQIDKPMTIAEIANPHDKTQDGEQREVIGFRRKEVLMN
jgi:ATPase family associated with various cellular activities (AAA)